MLRDGRYGVAASQDVRSRATAFNTARKSDVSRTSWVRTIDAPRKTATAVAPRVPKSRSCTGLGFSYEPSMRPMVVLRELSNRTGRPGIAYVSVERQTARLASL